MRTVLIMALMLGLATGALAQGSTVADFEGGMNNGDWTYGNSADAVETVGGTPDGWFHNHYLNTFAPILQCDDDADGWTGDYVAAGASRISFDLQTVSTTSEWFHVYNLTPLFRNTMGTPDNIEDDIHVYPDPYYGAGSYCPAPGAGWVHYEFDIPSDFVGAPGELPEGWAGGSYLTGNSFFPPDATWQDVMSDIGRIEIWHIHPDFFGAYEWFDMGADNIVLEWDGPAIANESMSFGEVKNLFR